MVHASSHEETPCGRSRIGARAYTYVQVHPTPPPVFPAATYSDTKASRLRRRHVQCRKEAGQYDTVAAKEERAAAARKLQLQQRAKAHVAREQRSARQRILQGLRAAEELELHRGLEGVEGGAVAAGGDLPTSEARGSEAPGADRLTEAHRQSRHQKIERGIGAMTRDIVSRQGLDVLRFVEGSLSARQIIDSIRDSLPSSKAEVCILRHVLRGVF
jgi:hypothetical protein